MAVALREILRYVLVGLGFGLVWAVMQYANGQVRDVPALLGPVAAFGLAGAVMWCVRRAVRAVRGG